MSFSLSIQNSTIPFLNGLQNLLTHEEILAVAGEAVANRLRAHFDELQSSRPNANGWPRQNFWAQVSRSVKNTSLQTGSITVTIDRPGVALRFFGGDIQPVTAQYLAIPATAD